MFSCCPHEGSHDNQPRTKKHSHFKPELTVQLCVCAMAFVFIFFLSLESPELSEVFMDKHAHSDSKDSVNKVKEGQT